MMKSYYIQILQELFMLIKLPLEAAYIFFKMIQTILFRFSDEATFHVRGKLNNHNCIIGMQVIHISQTFPKINVMVSISKF